MSRHQILELCEKHMSSGDYVKASNILKNVREETEDNYTSYIQPVQIMFEHIPLDDFDDNLREINIMGKKKDVEKCYRCQFFTITGGYGDDYEAQECYLSYSELVIRLNIIFMYRKTETITIHSEEVDMKIEFNKFKKSYENVYDDVLKKMEGDDYETEHQVDARLQCHDHIVKKYLTHVEELCRKTISLTNSSNNLY